MTGEIRDGACCSLDLFISPEAVGIHQLEPGRLHTEVSSSYTHKAKAYRGLCSDPNNRDLLTEKVFALGPPVDQRVKRKVKKTTKL